MERYPVTEETLVKAAIAAHNALDACGLKVILCRNAMNTDAVRRDLWNMCTWFTSEALWMYDNGEETAARNLALVANLLSEHLKFARELREKPDACKPQTS
jgi:hypothetical protein